MKPKFTDSHKFPHGYRQAVDTNVSETFKRVRRQQEELAKRKAEIEAEQVEKVKGHIEPKKRTA